MAAGSRQQIRQGHEPDGVGFPYVIASAKYHGVSPMQKK